MWGMQGIIMEWVGTLIGGLKVAAGFIGARVMAFFGLSFVTFQYVLPHLKEWLMDRAQLLPPRAVEFIAAIGFDIAIVLVVSAYVAQFGMGVFLVATSKLEEMLGNAGN